MTKLPARGAAGFLLIFWFNCTKAGPPLAIDDPGILEPGEIELIIAITGYSFESFEIRDEPLVDVSVGVSENSQLTFLLPRTVLKARGTDDRSGLGFAAIGYKWRFYASDSIEWAVAPTYAFPASHDVFFKDEPEDVRVMNLPLLYSWSRERWNVTAQAGWAFGSDGSTGWDYGTALTWTVSPWADLMAGVYGVADRSFDHRTLNFQVGADFTLVENFHLLASYSSRLLHDQVLSEKLKHSWYFGLQWFIK